MQYTLRNIPAKVDAVLRRRAKQENKSLNEVALEALARGVGMSGEVIRQRDLAEIAGSWKSDPVVDEVLAEQRRIDAELWK